MSPHYQHRTIPTGTANPDTTGETMTSTDVTTFDYHGTTIRTFTGEDGEPRFVVSDLARLLGYRDAAAAARMLREHQQGYTDLSTPGGMQSMKVCTEGGMNRLVMRSNAANAEDVQDWITDEVMVSIRKTGTYGVAPAPVALPTPREMAAAILAEADRADAAEVERDQARAQVEAAAPAVAAHAAFMAADPAPQLVATVAKEHGWTQRRMREFLMEEGMIFHRVLDCGARQWEHYAKHAAHFDMKQVVVDHRRGQGCAHSTLRLTGAGRTLVASRIERRRGEALAALTAPVGPRLTVVDAR